MGILEQVIQMREQGMPDQDIVSQLQEQGTSPKTINDALNQANIKSAVNNGMEDINPGMQYNAEDIPVPQGQERYSPSSQEYAEDVYMPQSQTASSPGRVSQEYTYQEPYSEPSAYVGTDADTMIELAQQVFSEKIKKIQQQIDNLNEFKAIYQTRTDGIYERLKKIEGTIDALQSAILEKVGSYGQGIESVKKELSMMQDTYGQIVDAISDKHHMTQTHHLSESSTEPVNHHIPEHHHTPEHEHYHPAESHHIVHHKTQHTVSKKSLKKKR